MIETTELLPQLEEAAARADLSRGPVLLSATVEAEALDPAALVFASRRADDRWFCWEQPDREGFAIAGLGAARELVSRGPDRFAEVAEQWRRMLDGAQLLGPAGAPAGAGPLATGGFSFAADGGAEAQWSSLPPALLVLPEISASRVAGHFHVTANVVLSSEADAERALSAVRTRLESVRETSLGIAPADPHPTGEVHIDAPHTPGHYEDLVSQSVGRIAAGDLEKVVLAREIRVATHAAHDPAAIFAALRELFPSCFCFCCGTPEAAFLGASPELLVRRNGAGAATVALAGTTGRSADPAVDDHLGERLLHSDKDREEHRIVVERIERSLGPLSVWVQGAPEPGLIKVANVQHLATPIRAQLADPLGAVELAGLLHPTPAVGGEPREAAVAAIAEIEGIDRGWYAGPVGWVDAAEDGEFCVALRSGLIRDRTAHLYAGAGIVGDSDPAAELAETELKLGAMLPLVSG